MIEYIKGNLTDLTPTYAVVEAAGVGYAIHIALPSYSALAGKENTETKLYVTEIIREDAHELFGFFSRGERELFLMLMTVSGIGANTARMIMSYIDYIIRNNPEDFVQIGFVGTPYHNLTVKW